MIRDPALVVVDLQNDYCKQWNEATGEFVDDPEIQPVLTQTARLVARYRESGRTPIFLRTEHSERTVSEEWKRRYDRRGHMKCRPGTAGAAFVPELDVRDDDVVVTKHRYNGFVGTDLDLYLSTNDVSRVLFAGVGTNVCVMGTLRGAYSRDYAVTLVADCTGSSDPDLREATLRNVEEHFGEVLESADVEL